MELVSQLLNDILLLRPHGCSDAMSAKSTWSDRDLATMGMATPFVRDNQSRSKRNVLRGLHYQIERPQGKLVRVISGSIFDAVVDLRRSSPHFGQYASFGFRQKAACWPGYRRGMRTAFMSLASRPIFFTALPTIVSSRMSEPCCGMIGNWPALGQMGWNRLCTL